MASVDWSAITEDYASDGSGADIRGRSEGITNKQAICGRSKETSALFKSYQQLLQTKQAQTVIVHGESGSGKTALVYLLRDHICNVGIPGYFVAAKYFQNSGGAHQEAHSAIMAAFSDLCDLVAQSDNFNEYQRQSIKEALGADAQLLVKSISNLSPIMGKMEEVESEASVGKFKIACKTFLRAIASDKNPVVIFLDDVHWADEGSRQLIQMFLHDAELKNVMFILAYRDEEAIQVETMIFHSIAPVDIQLSNLDAGAVLQMVSSIAGSTSNNVRDLSELVAKRTAGNPFHVLVFMEMIQRDGLLVFDSSTHSCTFNVEKIQGELMASESLAQLLMRKIHLLPFGVTEILKVASLVGYRFDATILARVACATIEEKRSADGENVHTIMPESSGRCYLQAMLSDAIKEGFIETRSDGYQFTHDKLQACFQSMIDNAEMHIMHLHIGNAYLACTNSNERVQMYNAAVHLNRAPGFLWDDTQRPILARINFNAATYCEEKFAFVQAAAMLRTGLNIFGPHEIWNDKNYSLTFQMMESLAKIQLIVGDFEGCKDTTRAALERSTTVEMKVNLLLIAVEVRMAENKVGDSLTTAFRALRTLGVRMPQKITVWHVVAKLLRVRRMLSRKTDDNLLNLPIVEDRLVSVPVKLLIHVCTYSIVNDDVKSSMYASLLATELTLKNGLSPYSPTSFVVYGVMSLRNVDRAYRYGKLALKMLERMSCKEGVSFTVGLANTLILSRKEHVSDLIGPLCRAADAGYQRGDSLPASYAWAHCFHMHGYLGTHLATVEEAMRPRYTMMSDLSQNGLLFRLQPSFQYVLNMQSNVSSWEDIAVLSGEIMNEDEYFRQAHETKQLPLTMVGLLVKSEIASYFEQHSLAALIQEEIEAFGLILGISYVAPFFYFNAARTQFSLYELSGKRRHLRKGRRLKKSLDRMHSAECPNTPPLIAFLDAGELARRKGIDESSLRDVYSSGIEKLKDAKQMHLEGILNEKAGFNFARRGWCAGAEQYFERALHIYKFEWGATAKYNWLVEERKHAIREPTELDFVFPNGTFIRCT